ncbi:interferon-induced transmembrane protein 3-like [Antennarius striatus]|uniref:interferon-induced transmembrane protein 3-like n=1 Tax=Antennarius striatus TaxID=241820 RepID=UPI0035B1DA40
MNPAVQPPLGEMSGKPGQPGPPVVQYTVAAEAPKDHVLWSLFTFVYSNPFCLGLVALIYSIKTRDRKWTGDVEGARHYSSKARCFNIWATALGAVMFVLCIIAVIIRILSQIRTYR